MNVPSTKPVHILIIEYYCPELLRTTTQSLGVGKVRVWPTVHISTIKKTNTELLNEQ